MAGMRVLYNPSTDPAFNLASEEYLLDNSEDDVFMLWRNEPSVIIGAYQNPYAEVDLDYTNSRGVKVVRRITGGGAVFHDLGNVNYTFICRGVRGNIDFEKYTRPIIDVLRKLGVPASLDGRNDIVAEGRKISGNAQCKRAIGGGLFAVLHHGTLLFSADLSGLAGCLKVNAAKISGKGIKSVRSRVVNIRDIDTYRGPADVLDFISELFKANSCGAIESLSEREIHAVSDLALRKYATWEWNFGKTPTFSSEKTNRFPFGEVSIRFEAEGGVISDVAIFGDFFSARGIAPLLDCLKGTRLDAQTISDSLNCLPDPIGEYINGMTKTDLLDLINK